MFLRWLCRWLCKGFYKRQARLALTLTCMCCKVTAYSQTGGKFMGLLLKDSEKVDLAIQGFDAAGNPAPP